MFTPIYLHFMDRELREAVQLKATRSTYERWISDILVFSPAFIYCGLSPAWETPKIGRFISTLLVHDQIHLLSSHATLDEFLYSRKRAYAHDRQRYPLYFSDKQNIHRTIKPTHPKTGSATLALKKNLSQWAIDNLTHDSISPIEFDVEDALKTTIPAILQKASHEAITLALFAPELHKKGFSVAGESMLRRKISSLYTSHYMDIEGGDIVTGIKGLELFDHLARSFPCNDMRLMPRFLDALGLTTLRLDEDRWREFLSIRGRSSHYALCETIRLSLSGIQASLGTVPSELSISGKRNAMEEQVERLLRGIYINHPQKAQDILWEATYALQTQVNSGKMGSLFQQEVESMSSTLSLAQNRVLIIVATEVERNAILTAAFGTIPESIPRKFFGDHAYVDLGHHGGCDLLMVQTEMASATIGGSLITTLNSIDALKPTSVVMTGIAFGLKGTEKQKIGEILVAKQLHPYELQRVGQFENGKAEIIPRGDKIPCSPRLLSRFRSGQADWNVCDVDFGLVLSGEKLCDSPELVAELRRREPEALGGEMEGTGLSAASGQRKVDWILVKAICDWGMGKDTPTKKQDQLTAAQNAAEFVFHVIRQGGLAIQ